MKMKLFDSQMIEMSNHGKWAVYIWVLDINKLAITNKSEEIKMSRI